jgi:hypothetical protein
MRVIVLQASITSIQYVVNSALFETVTIKLCTILLLLT